ncbi:hypothetical protein FB45DRAFT_148922 [Roridomyces roridus]|uniref:Ubiquitin-like domain-containing protein n=1 Tax=Roridomyces roridus TaxID=1738132 RepID=A0AAD7BG78_9AGAR|nr:hypothetical protein FB45DRAFT_148922 [Roridomyces roridus]
MPSAVAVALTFGSFGDILEAAHIAKRIIDVLRSASEQSSRRRALMATLEGLCDDMSQLTFVFDQDRFTDRLWAEVDLCRSLLDDFSAKINVNDTAGLVGLFRKTWSVAVEERDLASWRVRISERREALRDLLASSNSIRLHELGDHIGRVGSQVQYIGSRVDSVESQVLNVGNFGTLNVVLSTFLSAAISQRGIEIRKALSDIRQVDAGVQQLIAAMALHHIREPVFYLIDPVGRSIPIPLHHFSGFDHLDRILKAYLCDNPEAGSSYIDRGDYSIVATDGQIITQRDFRLGGVKEGMKFDVGIIKRARNLPQQYGTCPQCGQANAEVAVDKLWIDCSQHECRLRYQSSYFINTIIVVNGSMVKQQCSTQDFSHGDHRESFRMIQVVYEVSKLPAVFWAIWVQFTVDALLQRFVSVLQCCKHSVLTAQSL